MDNSSVGQSADRLSDPSRLDRHADLSGKIDWADHEEPQDNDTPIRRHSITFQPLAISCSFSFRSFSLGILGGGALPR
jgi:hypothetical protein